MVSSFSVGEIWQGLALFYFAGFFPAVKHNADCIGRGGLLALVFRKPKLGQSAKEPFDAQSGE